MDLQRGRRGLSLRPSAGWPLDGVLVGVGTLRTLRELLRPYPRLKGGSYRAWDIALWSGVTPQGTSHCLRRLCDVGIVRIARPAVEGHAAVYELDSRHPLIPGMSELFAAEYDIVRVELRPSPNRRRKGADATSRRPNPS